MGHESPRVRRRDSFAVHPKEGPRRQTRTYASNGVPFYLILDPEDCSALLLSLDPDGTYRELPPEDPFEIHPGCVLQLDVAPLFV